MSKASSPARAGPAEQPQAAPVERFVSQPQTLYGGAGLLRRFCEKLHLRQALSQVTALFEGTKYSFGQYLAALIYAALLGLLRQSHIAGLRRDPAAMKALGLEAMPSQPSLSGFLRRCQDETAWELLRVNAGLVRRMRAGVTAAVIDLDGTIVSTRGRPEGADFGYNPKRKGSPCYFLLAGFWGGRRDILAAELCRGKEATVSARHAIRLLEQARQALPRSARRLKVRGDAAFYSHEFLCCLERRTAPYAIAMRRTARLEAQMLEATYTQADRNGTWALAELWYTGDGWEQPRRVIVVRKRLDEKDPQEQRTGLFGHGGYSFQPIVTTMTGTPEQVWHFYNHRSCLENIIKEGQEDFGLDHVLSACFAGNKTWVAISVLAYNLLNWFRERVLGQRCHRITARTLRRRLIEIPARLVLVRGREYLELWAGHAWRELFVEALVAVNGLALA